MTVVVVVIVVAVVVAAAIAWWVVNRRRHADGVDSFRRQIDALSPEARRSVVEQLQKNGRRKRGEGDDAGDA